MAKTGLINFMKTNIGGSCATQVMQIGGPSGCHNSRYQVDSLVRLDNLTHHAQCLPGIMHAASLTSKRTPLEGARCMGGRNAMQQTKLNLSIFMNKDSKGSCHQSVGTVGVWCGGCSSRAQICAQHLLLWQECIGCYEDGLGSEMDV